MFVFELFVLLGLPLLFSSVTTYLTWNALSRPFVFLVVATVVLYLVYAASMWLLAAGPVGYTLSIRSPGESPASEPLFLLLPPYKIPLIAFTLAAVPVLVFLLRAFRRGRADEV